MKTKVRLAAAAGTASAVLLAAPATATAYTSTWIGKGEVQEAFGLNNAQIQQLVADDAVSFVVVEEATYAQDCEKELQRHTIEKTFTKTTTVNATVTTTARHNSSGKNGSFTGWSYTLGEVSGSTGAPTDLCTPGQGAGEDNNGFVAVSDVYRVGAESSGGLYAVIDGVHVLLQPTV